MNRLTFNIDGTQSVSKPENFEGFKISVDWTSSKGVEVDFDSLIWKGEDAERIIAMRTDQYGSLVGRPLQVNVVDEDGSLPLPLMMIDLRSKFVQTGCDEVEHGVRFVNQRDWLTNKAAGLQFARLEANGDFQSTDYVQVPYNLNYIPDALQLALIALNTLNLSIQTAKLARDTAETIQDIALAVPIPNLIAMAAVKALLRLAENALIIIALVKSIKTLGEQLYSRTRYHTAIKVESLFRVALAELGLTFQSSIFQTGMYKDAVIMPSKTERGKFSIALKNGGAPRRPDNNPVAFFGKFIETMQQLCNADFKITNGIFVFERWDFWQSSSTYVLQDNFTDQSRRLNEFTDNADSFKGGYSISFKLDQQDRNTLDNFNGTAYDVVTQNANTIGVEFDNDGGSEVIDLPLALGTNKGPQTKIEGLLIGLFNIVDGLASLQGLNSGLVQSILNRSGNLQLSDHFTSVPKMLIMNNGLLALNQRTLISAPQVWNDSHFINSFYPINGIHNQWVNYSMPVKMCRVGFKKLLDNNFAKTADGADVEVLNIDWIAEEDSAELYFRVNELYLTNLKQSYITGENTTLADNHEV